MREGRETCGFRGTYLEESFKGAPALFCGAAPWLRVLLKRKGFPDEVSLKKIVNLIPWGGSVDLIYRKGNGNYKNSSNKQYRDQ